MFVNLTEIIVGMVHLSDIDPARPLGDSGEQRVPQGHLRPREQARHQAGAARALPRRVRAPCRHHSV